MIKPSISIKGKINTIVELETKTNASIIREYPELEDLRITPTASEQKFKSEKYGYNEVIIEAIESEKLNVIPKNEKQRFEGLFNIVNVEEIKEEDVVAEINFSDSDIVEIQPTKGSYLQKVTINKDENLKSSNVRKDIVINGVEGEFESIAEITDLSYMFMNGVRINEIDDILKISKNATNAIGMFYQNASITTFNNITTLDLSDWDSKNITDMTLMFYQCKQLTKLNLGGKFNTENVAKVTKMFSTCTNLIELDLSQLNFNKLSNIQNMFESCSKLQTLKLGKFNAKVLTDTYRAFVACTQLKSLDLGNLDTKNVTTMYQMFQDCRVLTDLPKINADSVKNITYALYNMYELTNFGGMINLGKAFGASGYANISTYALNLSTSTKLTHESLMNVINGLYDLNLNYEEGATVKTQSLNIGSTNIAKLTDEEIAIATSKRLVCFIKRKGGIYVN